MFRLKMWTFGTKRWRVKCVLSPKNFFQQSVNCSTCPLQSFFMIGVGEGGGGGGSNGIRLAKKTPTVAAFSVFCQVLKLLRSEFRWF